MLSAETSAMATLARQVFANVQDTTKGLIMRDYGEVHTVTSKGHNGRIFLGVREVLDRHIPIMFNENISVNRFLANRNAGSRTLNVPK